MWVWLGVGVAGYLALMCVVILVLRAAKARNAAERASDAADPEVPWNPPGPPTPGTITVVSGEERPPEGHGSEDGTASTPGEEPMRPSVDKGPAERPAEAVEAVQAPAVGETDPAPTDAGGTQAPPVAPGTTDTPGPRTGEFPDDVQPGKTPAEPPSPGSLRR